MKILRVHSNRREYATLVIACTNTLRKSSSKLWFYINIYRKTKDLLIDVDSFVDTRVLCIDIDYVVYMGKWKWMCQNEFDT